MNIRTLQFRGHFEESAIETAEELAILTPEKGIERELLAWSIMPRPESVTDDDARPGLLFTYALGERLDEGLYRLLMTCRDRSGKEWEAEIAAALLSSPAALVEDRSSTFVPFWLLREGLHFKTPDEEIAEKYSNPAFGRLNLGSLSSLPHRRLFRALT